MTNAEMLTQIKSLKEELRKLQLQLNLNKKPMKRILSEDLINKYGERMDISLIGKDGLQIKNHFFGDIVKPFSVCVRRRLFPEQTTTQTRGANIKSTVVKKADCLSEEQYELYMLYMERLMEFLVEIDDALKGETS
jgi:hypothetical protein